MLGSNTFVYRPTIYLLCLISTFSSTLLTFCFTSVTIIEPIQQTPHNKIPTQAQLPAKTLKHTLAMLLHYPGHWNLETIPLDMPKPTTMNHRNANRKATSSLMMPTPAAKTLRKGHWETKWSKKSTMTMKRLTKWWRTYHYFEAKMAWQWVPTRFPQHHWVHFHYETQPNWHPEAPGVWTSPEIWCHCSAMVGWTPTNSNGQLGPFLSSIQGKMASKN